MAHGIKCALCEKIAVVPPFCLSCLLSMTDEEHRIQSIVIRLREDLAQDISNDCKMCGKPTADGRPDGFCATCRTVWNG